MNLQELLGALEATCEGKGQADRVELDAIILETAKNELKEQAQLRKDLEQARDEASMRPSVARKLNEKIRALEAELEQLRTNKKVKDLEKKVAFLSEELKQSYTTKNFTLKKQLLDLEKQYRAHINVDPAMAAFWADVTVLMDENRDKDSALKFAGPPSALAVPWQSAGSHPETVAAPAAAAAAAIAAAPAAEQATGTRAATSANEQQAGTADNTGSHNNSTAGSASSAAPAAGEGPGSNSSGGASLQSHPACGVLSQVEAFTSKINEEAASAAAVLHDGLGSHHSSSGGVMNRTASGEVVVRHGAGFRVVRAPGVADGAAESGIAAAAGAVVEEHLQPVHIVKDTIANKIKDVTFRALPADLGSHLDEQQLQQLQYVIDARALDSKTDVIRASVNALQQLFTDAAAVGTADVDLQQQAQQLAAAAQQLSTAAADASALQQQQAEADALLTSVEQLRRSFNSSSSAGDSSAAAVVDKQLSAVLQEVQQLQQLQQQANREASSQALLLQVFKEFLQQLEQQGLIAPAAEAAAAEGQLSQQHVLVELLQGFLQANPQLPQLLAAQVTPPSPCPAATAAAEEEAASSMQRAASVHVSTQADAETAHAETQSEPLPSPSVHAETQSDALPSLSVHVSTQADPPASPVVHASTQADPLPSPSVHAAVQAVVAAEQATAAVQTAAAEHAHASTQAAHIVEQLSAGVQTELSHEHEEPQPEAAAAAGGEGAGRPTVEVPSDSAVPEVAAAAAVAAAIDAEAHQGAASPAAGVPAYAAAAAEAAARDMATGGSSALPPLAPTVPGRPSETYSLRKQGSGIIYSASGSELSIGKVAVGTQLDLLHELMRKKGGEPAAAEEPQPSGAGAAAAAAQPVAAAASGGGAADGSSPEANDPGSHVAMMLTVKPEELTDMEAVARELSKLRADNMELAANMSVTQSLVEHLNKTMKDAIDKADDAEAETAQFKHQLAEATATLQQLKSEHVELTKVLIDAKVEIAEKKGQLVALVRNLRRAVESSQPHGIKQEVQLILSDVPDVAAAVGSEAGIEPSQTSHTVSRLLERVSSSRGTIGSFTANLGHALGSGGSRIMGHAPSKRRSSDNGTAAAPAAGLPERTASGAAAAAAAAPAVPERQASDAL